MLQQKRQSHLPGAAARRFPRPNDRKLVYDHIGHDKILVAKWGGAPLRGPGPRPGRCRGRAGPSPGQAGPRPARAAAPGKMCKNRKNIFRGVKNDFFKSYSESIGGQENAFFTAQKASVAPPNDPLEIFGLNILFMGPISKSRTALLNEPSGEGRPLGPRPGALAPWAAAPGKMCKNRKNISRGVKGVFSKVTRRASAGRKTLFSRPKMPR